MKTLFDYDKIEIVTVEEARKEYPDLNWEMIRCRFTWRMGRNLNVEVLTLADLNLCVVLNNRGIDFNDINYDEVEHCSVCRKVLLPDDECYADYKTNEPLCDEHSKFNESTNNYQKIVFN